jgi:hypothetical protein
MTTGEPNFVNVLGGIVIDVVDLIECKTGEVGEIVRISALAWSSARS